MKRLAMTITIVVAAALWLAVPTQAAAPSLLKRIGQPGSGAGDLFLPRDVAVDPNTGHVYVAESGKNSRVSEFTAWGDFVKAFGWNVAPGAVDEEQELRIRATAGQFNLTFDTSTTPDLPFDATAGEVGGALNALPSISGSGGQVEVEGGPGGIAGTTPSVYVIRFEGTLGGSNVADLIAGDGATPLSGGVPPTLEVLTRADGTPGGVAFESCTAASGCSQGTIGEGAGQFDEPTTLTVDQEGSVYVADSNRRIQKFDSAGRFRWMIGGEVNKTTKANICTQTDLANLQVCGAGVNGSAPREFASFPRLAAGVGGEIFAADIGRIQQFDGNGSYVGQIVPKLDPPTPPRSNKPDSLALDPISGDFYWAFQQGVFENEFNPGVFRLSPSGELLDTLESDLPRSLETDQIGNVYVIDTPQTGTGGIEPGRVVGFAADGTVLIPPSEGFAIADILNVSLTGLGANSIGTLFVSYSRATTQYADSTAHVDVYGPAPVPLEPPPKEPPAIEDQYAASVDTDGAVLRVSIDPKFWADTRYYVEYGTEDCAVSECETAPLPPGSLLTDQVVSGALTSSGVFLNGLDPGTTYHYRFVAESSGGGPVFGPDAIFTTAKAPTDHAGQCAANEALRGGPSASLPDCRAYEMVSPVDKNGGDVSPICQIDCYPAALEQSAEAGSALTYSSYKSFGDAQSAPYVSQYLARRDPGMGWRSDGITPPQGNPLLPVPEELDTLYKAFTSDLGSGWVKQAREPALAPGSEAPNIYRRDNADGSYQALSPQGLGATPELQGITPDGRCSVFRVEDALTEEAKPGLTQVYRSCDGQLDLVSYLPNGNPSAKASSTGTPVSLFLLGREHSVFNAISDDGSRVFWSEASNGAGPLYLRLPDREETFAISKDSAFFWGAAADGSKAVYQGGETLVEARIDSEGTVAPTTMAPQTLGVMGMSEDAERVYFASRADLDAEGPAQAGQPNLYLREGSGEGAVTRFVVTLVEDDHASLLRPISPQPVRRTARITPDGGHLTFMSFGALTGFDNTDQKNGKPNAEVFLYDAEAEKLVCASCNPTGARPIGRELLAGLKGSNTTFRWAAAKIPTHQSQLYGSRVLSDDGTRLYFESYEPLTPLDTNGKADVYQWEKLGAGSCSEGDGSFQEQSGGCVELISSGKSPSDSSFVDASADGKDVFIRTASSLLPQDPGSVDIYDAREGGGFPPPPSPPAACEGEACQGPISAPNDPTPASESYQGPGNVREASTKKPCPKGKVRRKGKCVKKKGKSKHKQNKQNRRAGR